MTATDLGVAGFDTYNSTTKQSQRLVTLNRAIPAGHTLLIVTTLEGSGGVTAIMKGSDTHGNTYTNIPGISDGTTRAIYAMTCPVTTSLASGDGVTVSATTDGTTPYTRGRWTTTIRDISGLTASALDVTAYNTGNAANPPIPATGLSTTTAAADEIAYAFYSLTPTATPAPASGWTDGGTLSTATTGSTNDHLQYTEFKTLTTTGGQSATVTQTATGFAGMLITLKAAATQIVPPSGTVSGTGWARTGGASDTAALNDSDDASYWQSPDNPTGTNALTIGFATPSPLPTSSDTVTLRTRLAAPGSTTASVELDIYRGGTTLVQAFTGITLSTTPSWYAVTLGSTQQAAVTAASAWSTITGKVLATAAP